MHRTPYCDTTKVAIQRAAVPIAIACARHVVTAASYPKCSPPNAATEVISRRNGNPADNGCETGTDSHKLSGCEMSARSFNFMKETMWIARTLWSILLQPNDRQ